jgi:hypothetical protein
VGKKKIRDINAEKKIILKILFAQVKKVKECRRVYNKNKVWAGDMAQVRQPASKHKVLSSNLSTGGKKQNALNNFKCFFLSSGSCFQILFNMVHQ